MLDFYGGLLSENQRTALDLYINSDYSCAEVSEHMNITRQGVFNLVKRGREFLCEIEEKLGLYQRFSELTADIEKIKEDAQQILDKQEQHNNAEAAKFAQSILNRTECILQTGVVRGDLIM